MNDELSQAFENVAFITKVLEKSVYTAYEATKVVNAMRFLKAIEDGIKAKKAETNTLSQEPEVTSE